MRDDEALIAYEPRHGGLREAYSDEVIAKAAHLIEIGEIEQYGRGRFLIRRTAGGHPASTVYSINVVELDEQQRDHDGLPEMICSCINGRKRGGKPSCYHSAAALMMLGY